MRVLLLLGLVGAALGAPKSCCMNHKWTGTMIQVGATKPATADPVIVDNSFTMDYDYDAKMIMLNGVTIAQDGSGTRYNITVFDDFAHDKRYVVAGGQCTASDVPPNSMTPPCVPGNFTYEGSYTLGGAASTITVNSFAGTLGSEVMRFTVTDDCTPVTMTQYGGNADGSGNLFSFVFANVQQGQLSTANPFMMPKSCATPTAPVG